MGVELPWRPGYDGVCTGFVGKSRWRRNDPPRCDFILPGTGTRYRPSGKTNGGHASFFMLHYVHTKPASTNRRHGSTPPRAVQWMPGGGEVYILKFFFFCNFLRIIHRISVSTNEADDGHTHARHRGAAAQAAPPLDGCRTVPGVCLTPEHRTQDEHNKLLQP